MFVYTLRTNPCYFKVEYYSVSVVFLLLLYLPEKQSTLISVAFVIVFICAIACHLFVFILLLTFYLILLDKKLFKVSSSKYKNESITL